MTRRRLLGTLAVGLVAGFLRVFPRRFLEEEPEEDPLETPVALILKDVYQGPFGEMLMRQEVLMSRISGCSSRLRTP